MATPQGLVPFDPVVISKERMDFLNQKFADTEIGSSGVIARSIAGEISNQHPEFFSYKTLKDGTAPIFDLLSQYKDLPPEKRQLSDNGIIRLLARDPEGKQIEEGSFFEGIAREFLPQSGGLAGAITGAKVGYKLQEKIPVRGTASVVTKFALPLFTSTAGFFGAYKPGEMLTDQLLGPEAPLLPGTTASYEAGKTAMGGLAWMPLPYLISSNVNFGGAQLLDNLALLRTGRKELKEALKDQTGEFPRLAEKYTNLKEDLGLSGAEALIKSDKSPRTIRLIRNIENLLSRTGEEARRSPKFVLGVEGLALLGQTTLAKKAEEAAPGQTGIRLAAETAGALTPTILGTAIASKIPLISAAFKSVFRKGGVQEAMQPILQYRENQVIKKILDELEKNGEDIEALIENLSNPQFLQDPDNPTEKIKLTAGAQSGSPTIIAFEQAADQLNRGTLGKERAKGSEKAIEAMRLLIYALMSTKDQQSLQLAADLSADFFSASIQTRINNAVDNLLAANEQVLKGKQPIAKDLRTEEGVPLTDLSDQDLSVRLFSALEAQLDLARNKEHALWKAIPDEEITVFKDADGNELDYPQFLDAWKNLLPKTEEAYDEIGGPLSSLNKFVNRKRREFGLDQVTADGVSPGVPDQAVADLGKELTLKNVKLPEGFRVFQRNVEVVGEARKVRTTSVVDPNGNRIDLVRDPENKVSPYNADIIDGVTDDVSKNDTSFSSLGNTLADAVEDAANRMSKGRVRFQPRTAEPTAASAPDSTETPSLTVTEMEEMRSTAMNIGRKLRSQQDTNGARIAFEFADALLEDMNNFDQATTSAYHTARAYSKALNDTFTRAFAGDVMDVNKKGARRTPPELLHKKLEVGGSSATYLRLSQIQSVGQFMEANGLAGAENASVGINATIVALLRNAREASINPTTNEIDLKRLATWSRERQPLLDMFPALKADLADQEKAQILLNESRLVQKAADDDLKGMISFQNLLSGYTENPTTAVGEALSRANKNKWRSMNALLDVALGKNLEKVAGVKGFKLTNEQQKDALNGLKSSVLEWGMSQAGGTARSGFKPSVAYRAFFEPLQGARAGGSLVDWMVSSKIMPKSEAENLKTMLTEMMRYEIAQVNGTIDDIVEQAGPLLDFYLRVTGSNLGAKASGILGGGGGDLIARSAGSKILRQTFEDVPEAFQVDIMTKMMKDPEFLAAMLRRGVTEREKINIAQRASNLVYDFLGRPARRVTPSVGRETAEDDDNAQSTRSVPEPQAAVQEPQQNLMAQRFAQPTPTVIQPRRQPVAQAPAPRPPALPQGQANPAQRQRLAQLFPNDPLAQAAGPGGGIGSLFS